MKYTLNEYNLEYNKVNYKKGTLDSQPQVIKFTSCLSRVGGSLRVPLLPSSLKLVAMIYLKNCSFGIKLQSLTQNMLS
jgi:hypothetical protein